MYGRRKETRSLAWLEKAFIKLAFLFITLKKEHISSFLLPLLARTFLPSTQRRNPTQME